MFCIRNYHLQKVIDRQQQQPEWPFGASALNLIFNKSHFLRVYRPAFAANVIFSIKSECTNNIVRSIFYVPAAPSPVYASVRQLNYLVPTFLIFFIHLARHWQRSIHHFCLSAEGYLGRAHSLFPSLLLLLLLSFTLFLSLSPSLSRVCVGDAKNISD